MWSFAILLFSLVLWRTSGFVLPVFERSEASKNPLARRLDNGITNATNLIEGEGQQGLSTSGITTTRPNTNLISEVAQSKSSKLNTDLQTVWSIEFDATDGNIHTGVLTLDPTVGDYVFNWRCKQPVLVIAFVRSSSTVSWRRETVSRPGGQAVGRHEFHIDSDQSQVMYDIEVPDIPGVDTNGSAALREVRKEVTTF